MDISFWHFLWMTIVVFFWVTFLVIFVNVVIDIFRSKDLSGAAKAGWAIICLILPVIGVLLYTIVRGGGMAERAVKRQLDDADQLRTVVAPAGATPADEIASAKALLDSGAINEDEFAALKAKALS